MHKYINWLIWETETKKEKQGLDERNSDAETEPEI